MNPAGVITEAFYDCKRRCARIRADPLGEIAKRQGGLASGGELSRS